MLDKLSISRKDLQQLISRPNATEADVISWAQGKLANHPAQALARQYQMTLQQYSSTLAAASSIRPTSPLEAVLLSIAASIQAGRLKALSAEQLQQLPVFDMVAASLRRDSPSITDRQLVQEVQIILMSNVNQLLPTSWLQTLKTPSLWRYIILQEPSVYHKLLKTVGYDLLGLQKSYQQRMQLLAAAGADLSDVNVQLHASLPDSSSVVDLLENAQPQLAEAVSRRAEVRQFLAELHIAEWFAAQIGLSSTLTTSNSSSSSSSSSLSSSSQSRSSSTHGSVALLEVLSGRCCPVPELPAQVEAALADAKPALVDVLKQLPAKVLASRGTDVAGIVSQDPNFEVCRGPCSDTLCWMAA